MSTPHVGKAASVASIDYLLDAKGTVFDAKFERDRPAHDEVLRSIEEPSLRRRTAALLEAQDELSRLRAEGRLAEQDALHLLDERFGMKPEIKPQVRAILAKVTRAANRFHGAAETLDQCLRAFTAMTLSMLRLLADKSEADRCAQHRVSVSREAEAAAAWRKVQDERSTERVNASMQHHVLQASLKAALQESAALVTVLQQEVAEVEKEHQRDSHEVSCCTLGPWTRQYAAFSFTLTRSHAHTLHTLYTVLFSLVMFSPSIRPPIFHPPSRSRRSSCGRCKRRVSTRWRISPQFMHWSSKAESRRPRRRSRRFSTQQQ